MITYHHIGGRNGTYPLPLKTGVLLQDFHLILYDADVNCYNQMKNAERNTWGKVSVFPYCIGEKTGRASFNLNFHPTTNSLYPFNEKYATYGFVNNPRYGEYLLGDACQHMESIELDLYSLAEALKIAQAPGIDFLSLDVQGAEYDIIVGSKDLLARDCIGIQLEAEFVKLYQDQKTFFDINVLLEGMGFELIDLTNFGRCAPMSLPIGFRGTEQPLYAEALYLRTVESLMQDKNRDGLYKAALFSLIYQKTGLCFKYLTAAMTLSETSNDASLRYQHCLSEIWDLFVAAQDCKLPPLSQLFSNQMFQNYYQQKCNMDGAEIMKSLVRAQVNECLPQVESLQQCLDSPLEIVLKKYELYDVANTVKHNRLFESQCFMTLAADVNLVPV